MLVRQKLTIPALLQENNVNFLANIAQALEKFEALFGKFQTVHTFGRCASTVFAVKEKLHGDAAIGDHNKISSEVSTLILVDRDTDYVSMLLSPLTYEGLLDDHFGISRFGMFSYD